MRSSKPLKTESITIKEIVVMLIPATETAEIILIILVDFLEIKYRFAIYKGKYI
jgi:hypothetical protein